MIALSTIRNPDGTITYHWQDGTTTQTDASGQPIAAPGAASGAAPGAAVGGSGLGTQGIYPVDMMNSLYNWQTFAPNLAAGMAQNIYGTQGSMYSNAQNTAANIYGTQGSMYSNTEQANASMSNAAVAAAASRANAAAAAAASMYGANTSAAASMYGANTSAAAQIASQNTASGASVALGNASNQKDIILAAQGDYGAMQRLNLTQNQAAQIANQNMAWNIDQAYGSGSLFDNVAARLASRGGPLPAMGGALGMGPQVQQIQAPVGTSYDASQFLNQYKPAVFTPGSMPSVAMPSMGTMPSIGGGGAVTPAATADATPPPPPPSAAAMPDFTSIYNSALGSVNAGMGAHPVFTPNMMNGVPTTPPVVNAASGLHAHTPVLATVGERGPEAAILPPGAKIIPLHMAAGLPLHDYNAPALAAVRHMATGGSVAIDPLSQQGITDPIGGFKPSTVTPTQFQTLAAQSYGGLTPTVNQGFQGMYNQGGTGVSPTPTPTGGVVTNLPGYTKPPPLTPTPGVRNPGAILQADGSYKTAQGVAVDMYGSTFGPTPTYMPGQNNTGGAVMHANMYSGTLPNKPGLTPAEIQARLNYNYGPAMSGWPSPDQIRSGQAWVAPDGQWHLGAMPFGDSGTPGSATGGTPDGSSPGSGTNTVPPVANVPAALPSTGGTSPQVSIKPDGSMTIGASQNPAPVTTQPVGNVTASGASGGSTGPLSDMNNMPFRTQLNSGQAMPSIYNLPTLQQPGMGITQPDVNPFAAASTFKQMAPWEQTDAQQNWQSLYGITPQMSTWMMNQATPGYRNYARPAMTF